MHDKTGKKLSLKEIVSKSITRFNKIILELSVYILHCAGSIPFHHIRRLIYRMGGISIGKGSTIHMHARFYNPKNIIIGKDTIIGESVVLDGRSKLSIGNHVSIATNVMIFNNEHDIHAKHFSAIESVISEPVTIDDYVFIGPGVIILPGVHIKKGSIIAAGAVITKDTLKYSIIAGVPGKIIGIRKLQNPNYILGRADWFR